MKSAVGASATRHSVVTVERAPAARKARLKLCTPSPRTILPPSVSQAESVTRSTPERGSAAASGQKRYSEPGLPRSGVKSMRERLGSIGIDRGMRAEVQQRHARGMPVSSALKSPAPA